MTAVTTLPDNTSRTSLNSECGLRKALLRPTYFLTKMKSRLTASPRKSTKEYYSNVLGTHLAVGNFEKHIEADTIAPRGTDQTHRMLHYVPIQ